MSNRSLREIFALALPVALTYLGLMTMGLVDLIAVGALGARATGAVGIGTSFFAWGLVFGIGLIAGMDYFVSKAHGAGNSREGLVMLGQGLWLSLLVSVPVVGALLMFSYRLDWFSINPDVVPLAGPYLRLLALSLPMALVFAAYRNFLQAIGHAREALIVLFLANVLNAFLNYVFVFGHYGFAKMGTDGSAIATLISRIAMMVAIAVVVDRWCRKHLSRDIRRGFWRWDSRAMKELLSLGIPAAAQMTLEVGAFATSTTLAGRLTAQSLAAHQIVLNIASVSFMIPFGIGSATAVLVGQAIGQDDRARAGRLGWAGIFLGTGFMAVSCVFILVLGDYILQYYTTEPDVVAFATSILLIAGLFQLSDGAQTVLTGALRGLADTRSAMYANLVGHWFIGLPVGVGLCFFTGWGLKGLWIGLALGLTFVAGALLVVWRKKIGVIKFNG